MAGLICGGHGGEQSEVAMSVGEGDGGVGHEGGAVVEGDGATGMRRKAVHGGGGGDGDGGWWGRWWCVWT